MCDAITLGGNAQHLAVLLDDAAKSPDLRCQGRAVGIRLEVGVIRKKDSPGHPGQQRRLTGRQRLRIQLFRNDAALGEQGQLLGQGVQTLAGSADIHFAISIETAIEAMPGDDVFQQGPRAVQ